MHNFAALALVLALVCVALPIWLDFTSGYPKWLEMFVIHEEASLPHWLAATLLFSGVLPARSNFKAERVRSESSGIVGSGWLFLRCLMLLLSADEAGMSHERVGALYHDLTARRVLLLPSGYFLKASAPFIVVSTFFLGIFFLKLWRRNRRMALPAFAGLRRLIRYATEYSELGGMILLILFLAKHLEYLASNARRSSSAASPLRG